MPEISNLITTKHIYIWQWVCVYVLIGMFLFAASSRPFVLTVVTDDTELTTDVANRGFFLTYQQLPCMWTTNPALTVRTSVSFWLVYWAIWKELTHCCLGYCMFMSLAHLGRNRLMMFDNRAIKRIFGPKWEEAGDNRIMQSSIMCAVHHILLGWSDQRRLDRWGMQLWKHSI